MIDEHMKYSRRIARMTQEEYEIAVGLRPPNPREQDQETEPKEESQQRQGGYPCRPSPTT